MKYKDKPQNQKNHGFFGSDRYWELYWAATNEDNMYSAAEIENAQIELADHYLAEGDIENAHEYYLMAALDNSVLGACKLASLYEDRIVYRTNPRTCIEYYCMAAIAYEDIIDTMSPGENQQYIKELPSGAERYMNAVLFKHFPELGIPDADVEYAISNYLYYYGRFDRSDEWLKRAAEDGCYGAIETLDEYRRKNG